MNIFRPRAHFRTVQDIDLSNLLSRGINNLIVDLDETLRKRNSDTIPESSVKWLEDVKVKGFKACVISNNPFNWKMKKIEETLKTPVSFLALKPFPVAFRHAMKLLNSDASNTALIGDQLFTDVFGANMLGIYSILVDPITGAEKGIFRRMMRWLEQMVFPRVNLKL